MYNVQLSKWELLRIVGALNHVGDGMLDVTSRLAALAYTDELQPTAKLDLSSAEAWKVAMTLCDASTSAKINGQTVTQTELFNLATKFSCLSFSMDYDGITDEQVTLAPVR